MRLAANDDKLIETTRDDRLERARSLLRPARKTAMPNNAPLLASAGLAGAAILLLALVIGVPGNRTDTLKTPMSGSDLAPTAHPLRDAVPSSEHADFELSASPGTANIAPTEATPPVRDAVIIGTEGEAR